ncbi:MAG: hypothetical protein P4L44_03185 [Oryzomonas sp.]|uniref:hypothetical protein n=1 Tax=Oryzomonas sp. TaxID=2855186 RepID=UPI00284FA8C7|nr:hypothetical protein [Oryzomonas sp.]MDR3578949.1 hypothetical protein [Oryzomonas sp.]
MNQMLLFSRPGYIRALRNVLECAAVMGCAKLIRPEHVRFTAAGGQAGDTGNDAMDFRVGIPTHEFYRCNPQARL